MVDETNGRVGLARVEWQMSQLQSEVKALTARVMALYDQAVLLRVVELEGKVAAILTAKERHQDERSQERRRNWTQMALLIGGVVLGVLSTYMRRS